MQESLRRSTRFLPVAAVVAGGLLAFFCWTLPNWSDFSLVLSQWGDLWVVPENRLIIMALIIKLLSPVLVMFMIAILAKIWSLVPKRELEDAGEANDPVTPIPATTSPVISIRLLGGIGVWINVPGGDPVAVTIAENIKKYEMLAYIAWKQGEPIEREKLMEQVFGWRLRDEYATPDKLGDRFDSTRKALKKEIMKKIERVNTLAGKVVVDPGTDLFSHNTTGFWQLTTVCRVEDLALVDASVRVIEQARKEGILAQTVPLEVKEAAEQILASYKGDFLSAIIKRHAQVFTSWEGKISWVRKPFTQYRDAYLEALWVLGQYYANQAQESPSRAELCAKAAGFYGDYARYACNSRLDLKVSWGQSVGERVGMSEYALRRAIGLLGEAGMTEDMLRLWTEYSLQMRKMSDGKWRPSQETLDAIEAVEASANAHRFAVASKIE